jgi:hypothetical protein
VVNRANLLFCLIYRKFIIPVGGAQSVAGVPLPGRRQTMMILASLWFMRQIKGLCKWWRQWQLSHGAGSACKMPGAFDEQ